MTDWMNQKTRLTGGPEACATSRKCPKCNTVYMSESVYCPRDGTMLTEMDDQDTLIGSLIDGRYRVASPVDQGGMGSVYLAHQEALNRKVAVKALNKELAGNPMAIQRFKREVMAASTVANPHIIEVLDYGYLEDGRAYLVMEWVEGASLQILIQRESPLSLGKTKAIALQLCDALRAIHGNNIVHRDLKPANILLGDNQGQPMVKLLDFGIAKTDSALRLTRTGEVFGTPYYMSPEQAQGKAVDSRTDLYALGVILYEMTTGVRPFEGDAFADVLPAHIKTEPTPPEVKAPQSASARALSAVILRALRKRVEERYQSAEEMGEAIERAAVAVAARAMMPTLRESSVVASPREILSAPTALLEQRGSFFARRLAWPGAVALALAFLGGASLFYLRSGSQEATPPAAVEQAPGREIQPSARVKLVSKPNGVAVAHGGKVLGQTPLELILPLGLVILEFRLEGWQPAKKTYYIKGDRSINVSLVRASARKGR